MRMERRTKRNLLFAGLTLDMERLSLEHQHKQVDLRPKSFDVLHYLAENAGRIVAKDELIRKVWSGVSVTDDSVVHCINEIRNAIGDRDRQIIKTIPRRGYLFAAPVVEAGTTVAAAPTPVSSVNYAKSGEVHIAYRVWGDATSPLVFCPPFVTHVETLWTEPGAAQFLNSMGRFARVIWFDKRGTGMSDRADKMPSMDERVDDVRAVMDAVGVERATIMGPSEGGSLAAYFAATHPQRCEGLILYGAFASFTSWLQTEEALQQFLHYIDMSWGSGASLPMFAPSMAGNVAFTEWWGRVERFGASPADAMALMRLNSQIDITGILPSIRVPTLVVHRTADPAINIEGGRQLAARIPNARLVELSGVDHFPWLGENADEILRLFEEFMTGPRTAPILDRVLTTVMVAEIVGSTTRPLNGGRQYLQSPTAAHNLIVRDVIAGFRGRQFKMIGKSIVATFDGVSRAVQGGLALKNALARFCAAACIVIHVGEVEVSGTEVRGAAVDVAVGIVRSLDCDEVVVSRTVRDLVAGCNLTFEELGTRELGDTAEAWQLYRVIA
jgi:pimeloyl-ACP methyl ester carboxylesterase/DNA-binding winged helix-turn-helix (wHTH) protein